MTHRRGLPLRPANRAKRGDPFLIKRTAARLAQAKVPALVKALGGLALHAGKVLSAGKVWGEDMILFAPELRSMYCAIFLDNMGTLIVKMSSAV